MLSKYVLLLVSDIKYNGICLFSERKEILKNVSGDFQSRKLTGIIGPSGSGKTTLLDIISGYRWICPSYCKICKYHTKPEIHLSADGCHWPLSFDFLWRQSCWGRGEREIWNIKESFALLTELLVKTMRLLRFTWCVKESSEKGGGRSSYFCTQ